MGNRMRERIPLSGVRRHLRSFLPLGGVLPEDVWHGRHRFMLGLTWFHVVVISLVGPMAGYSGELSLEAPFRNGTVLHTVGEGLIVAFFAALGGWRRVGRTVQATSVAFGLMSSSAILVHLSGGYIELHFHFFVMLTFLALYQDWTPYILAIVYVAIHHGVVGVLWPKEVYNHPAAFNAPWTWAGIHAFFVLWASVGSAVAWRFNEMAMREILRLKEELEHRVIERTAQLEAANKELEAFSYSVSHDLRAPLRGIDGFSQVLLEEYADKLDEPGREHLQRVRAAARHMAHLIDDLLNLSRVARSEMHLERVDLSALTRTIAAEFRRTQPERQVDFVIADGLVVRGDPRLLRVALLNLLGNAWKFTGKHPRARIEFSVTQYNGQPAYFVRDDGAGFDMAYADKLFRPFERLHTAAEFEGTGIGLATVQRIIQRHGGRVWGEGVVERGATFYFAL